MDRRYFPFTLWISLRLVSHIYEREKRRREKRGERNTSYSSASFFEYYRKSDCATSLNRDLMNMRERMYIWMCWLCLCPWYKCPYVWMYECVCTYNWVFMRMIVALKKWNTVCDAAHILCVRLNTVDNAYRFMMRDESMLRECECWRRWCYGMNVNNVRKWMKRIACEFFRNHQGVYWNILFEGFHKNEKKTNPSAVFFPSLKHKTHIWKHKIVIYFKLAKGFVRKK